MSLKPGDKAPHFEGTIQDGSKVSLDDYKGKKLALYFYPKDNTSGCTAEACNLKENYDLLKDRNIEILGVSPDSERKHTNFIEKYSLPFDLLADTDKKVIQAYDAWGKKKMYGKLFNGVFRKTYIIDEQGRIEEVIEKVRTKDHARQILEAVENSR